MARPEILFPLFRSITRLKAIGDKAAAQLAKSGVELPRDMLYRLPYAGVSRRIIDQIDDTHIGQIVSFYGEIIGHEKAKGRRPYLIQIMAAGRRVGLVFFHANAGWLEKTHPIGARRLISGKLDQYDGHLQITHPDYFIGEEDAKKLPDFEPIYSLIGNIGQKQMRQATLDACGSLPDLPEWMDPHLYQENSWPSWKEALWKVHHPENMGDITPAAPARARLAYDEIFAQQLAFALARTYFRGEAGLKTLGNEQLQNQLRDLLPFELTGAQQAAIQEIQQDMATDTRMNRLLQGDVGSGKTMVAFFAMLAAIEGGGQAALLAPTEILARQHFSGLEPYMQKMGLKGAVLTGRDGAKNRRIISEQLAEGSLQLVFGTHAILSDEVQFRDLRLAVVDEQHRFGVRQRLELARKGAPADLLVMTATPIPRSLSLAYFGDMDFSVLAEKPAGRQAIETVVVSSDRMATLIARVRSALAEGRQIYWVCPLVSESEALDLAAAEDRFAQLRDEIGEEIVLLHGRMSGEEKERAMRRFAGGEARLMVATTVIEVGVDVPNASIIIIEHAERFGLAQLHQLRGRVGRGAQKSSCILLYAPPLGEVSRKRLEAIRDSEDGFKLAEIDLKLRGGGDMLGVRQSGQQSYRIAEAESLMRYGHAARQDARNLLDLDPDLTSERGKAARNLLYLLSYDEQISLFSAG